MAIAHRNLDRNRDLAGIRRNSDVGLRACRKILREQARQCDAGNAKWPNDF
jgi:hypothetical protein